MPHPRRSHVCDTGRLFELGQGRRLQKSGVESKDHMAMVLPTMQGMKFLQHTRLLRAICGLGRTSTWQQLGNIQDQKSAAALITL